MWSRWNAWMYGRYGNDALGFFLLLCYFVLNMFLRVLSPYAAVRYLPMLLLAMWLYRFLSRDLAKRRRENKRFLELVAPLKTWFLFWLRKWRERKWNRLFLCPRCKQTVRVPKGRGKLSITCPKCRHEFIRKT